MTSRSADTSVAIDPLIADRWSPRSFDPAHELSDQELTALLEAARWAPSGYNHQPWHFLVARRGSAGHKQLFDTLMPINQHWAGSASLLVAAVVTDRLPDGTELRNAAYDLGLSVAQLTLQAHALGLHSHQMGGFDPDQVRAAFGIPADHRAVAVIAVGSAAPADQLADQGLRERETAPRARRPLAETFFAESWGRSAV